MRVLVVEDYAPLREAVRQGLEEAGFAVDLAEEGETGLRLACTRDYDAILLDLMLPRLDGLTVLRRLRQKKKPVPVLILTARDTVDDCVTGLDHGADDYLVKPFAFEELVARLRALIRRRYETRGPVITIDDLEIDTAKRSVSRDGRPVELSAREYAVLEYLAMREGQVVSRTSIWEHIYDACSDPESNVVDVYIGYLRKKIELPDRPKLIHTRRGQGYLLGRSN